ASCGLSPPYRRSHMYYAKVLCRRLKASHRRWRVKRARGLSGNNACAGSNLAACLGSRRPPEAKRTSIHRLASFAGTVIEPSGHVFAGSEERECLLPHRHDAPCSGIARGSGMSNLGRKNAETAQFNAVASGHRVSDLIENGTYNVLNLALVKM